MLIRNMFGFLPAQLLSPAAQLLSMVLWTHWLTPAQLGVFTLVSATQEIAYTVSLSWFSTYALRYVPADSDHAATQRFLGAENWVVIGSLVAALLAGLVTALTLPANGMLLRDALIVGLYFASRGINAHYAERARAQSSFLAYTLLQTVGPVGAIGFASLRGGTVAGEHSVHFLSDNERLTLSHSAENRTIFAKGALRAALWLIGQKPGRYGMAEVLGL